MFADVIERFCKTKNVSRGSMEICEVIKIVLGQIELSLEGLLLLLVERCDEAEAPAQATSFVVTDKRNSSDGALTGYS